MNKLNLLRDLRGSCVKLLVISLTLLSTSPKLAAQVSTNDSVSVSGVIIDGNQRISADAIKIQLKETSGAISRETINQDVKTLYKTGFFDQVTASLVDSYGKRYLKYSVVEKPIVRKVFISGNEKIEEGDLSEILTFEGRKFFDKGRADALMRSAVSLYQSRGFYDAAFSYSVVPVGENQVDVTFSVDEGKKYKIREVRFRGVKEIDEDELIDVVQTKRYKWWSSWLLGTGRLNVEMLENDKALLRQYFLDHGFLDGAVSDPAISMEDGKLVVTFDVNEGPVYKIDTISVRGDLIDESSEATLEGIETESGEIFNASAVRQDAYKISDKFGDRGFAFANVVPDTRINRAEKLVALEFDIDKGKLVTVDRINVQGNLKTYDNVIRRELTFNEQETYSGTKIKRSQALLRRLGIFEEVNIATEPDPTRDDQVDVNVNVREGSTGTFSAGAGYSTSDGALFNARISENNIFGTGRSATISLDVGSERDNLIFSLDDRRLNDSYWAGGLDIYRTEREYQDFDRLLMGGGITFGYPLEHAFGSSFEDYSFSIKPEYIDIDIRDVDHDSAAQLVLDQEGRSTAGGITPKLVHNTIDNPLNPTEGGRQEVSMEVAGLVGSEEYYLFEARQQYYQPIARTGIGDFVFSWRTVLGYGDTYDDEDFPLFRRYFPGGINSVRGYKARSLGPKDEEGNEYGGSKELVNNFEVIFPIVQSAGLRGVVFYDHGQAFDDDENIDFGELREAYGIGIRWTSPLGPIRIEFGFPVDREDDEDSMVTLFAFGAPL